MAKFKVGDKIALQAMQTVRLYTIIDVLVRLSSGHDDAYLFAEWGDSLPCFWVDDHSRLATEADILLYG